MKIKRKLQMKHNEMKQTTNSVLKAPFYFLVKINTERKQSSCDNPLIGIALCILQTVLPNIHLAFT